MRPKDSLPTRSPSKLMQNQKRMLMEKGRDPMKRRLEQVASQGFLGKEASLGPWASRLLLGIPGRSLLSLRPGA